ncbi:glycoside hydrolase superfamily [Aspergillus transmontanensis]|uniref:alpha-galactosidase n=1 Tax=Aspergillus transmontanensis TaxID=1034304 RepID=A0A5N6VY20_9EURO|nr:glycoside hydrolase superfamily [Aspergillus transmontanensis]
MALPKTITLQTDVLRVNVYIGDQGAAFLQEVIPLPGSSRPSVSKYFANPYAPLVEVRLAGEGTAKHKSSKSLIGTYIGSRLHYQSHETRQHADTHTLDVTLKDPVSEVTVIAHLTIYQRTNVLRATSTIRNDSDKDIVVTQLSSLVLGGLTTGAEKWWSDYILAVPNNSWFREAQWIDHDLPSLGIDDYGVYGRPEEYAASLGHYSVSNRGTFSTEGYLPMGLLKRTDNAETWLWQVENNGSWRWEVGDWKDSVYLAAGGPVETDHDWRQTLSPGQEFTTVPVALCHVLGNYEHAFAEMTRYRRQMRRKHQDHEQLPIIFNDYMNCLMGDPTDEKILTLVDPVVRTGAEYFVIDAGWYADDSGWWDDVGLWEPSKKRFPMGFRELLLHLKTKGLTPGLWIEPEVIGVRSVVAEQLPYEAFFQRNGQRIVEKGRYQLDYRHAAVREHMHAVIHRLVTEYGVGYFKFDYNIEVTQGTDINCSSPGSGQLDHNRAYLQWVTELHDQYPGLVIENCSSGAQRMDYAMLAVHALQSTSDQQDPDRYAAIAAALPTAVTPEQGAIWVYPQPEWDNETNAMTVVNSLLGRVHLSGRLDELRPHQFELIKQGMDVYRTIRADLPTATAFWPLGLPHWHDDWVALGMVVHTSDNRDSGVRYLAVWRRGGLDSIELPIPALCGLRVKAELLYPATFPCEISWELKQGILHIRTPSKLSARLLKLTSEMFSEGYTM